MRFPKGYWYPFGIIIIDRGEPWLSTDAKHGCILCYMQIIRVQRNGVQPGMADAWPWTTNSRGSKQPILDPRYLFIQNKCYFKGFKLKTRGHGPLDPLKCQPCMGATPLFSSQEGQKDDTLGFDVVRGIGRHYYNYILVSFPYWGFRFSNLIFITNSEYDLI